MTDTGNNLGVPYRAESTVSNPSAEQISDARSIKYHIAFISNELEAIRKHEVFQTEPGVRLYVERLDSTIDALTLAMVDGDVNRIATSAYLMGIAHETLKSSPHWHSLRQGLKFTANQSPQAVRERRKREGCPLLMRWIDDYAEEKSRERKSVAIHWKALRRHPPDTLRIELEDNLIFHKDESNGWTESTFLKRLSAALSRHRKHRKS